MAYWISNKLKVAETFLQQIDQQAAESLGKGEKPRSDDPQIHVPSKSSASVSLKDQLKKKTQEINDYRGKLQSDPNVNVLNRNNSFTSPIESKPKSTLTDSDWTELLGTPSKSPSLGNIRKDERRQGATLGNRIRKINNNNNNNNNNSSLIKPATDGEESGSSGSSSSVELQNDGKKFEVQDMKPKDGGSKENYDIKKNSRLEMVSVSGKVDALSDVKIRMNDVDEQLTSNVRGNRKSNEGSRTSVSNDSKRGSSSTSDDGSDSDSDLGSSSESESELEREERRKQREKILAEKSVAKAVEAIKERENMVARLEGEKQSLEKILEELAKQQAKEASELQTTMMETMDAVELEKQRHNNTRMEALARLTKLETTNADLARGLTTAQKKLEVETNQVAELRQQIELKEVAHEELNRRISNSHHTGTYLKQLAASKGVEFEREILEAEYTFLADKIIQLEDKAKKLEGNIETTRKDIEDQTEVELELKRRLGQLTNHLIQKQAQVEALSSEKAILAFRIEAVSRLLDENKTVTGTSSRDLESGVWDLSQSKLRPLLENKIRSGRNHIGWLLKQLDSIFLAGLVFLRRNRTAKLWSLVYLVCLHYWVIYILLSHSWSSNEVRSGAVFSLENINNNTASV